VGLYRERILPHLIDRACGTAELRQWRQRVVHGLSGNVVEIVPAALAGERLDRIVALVLECSRTDAAAVVSGGGVTVDGVPCTSGKTRLAEGQQISVDPSLLPVDELPVADPSVELNVVYVDDDVIVVDKPAGLVVHPGAGNAAGTLVNGLLHRFPDLASIGEPHRPGIVHRLDVGTSGLLVVARTASAYVNLVDALSRRDVRRTYRVLVWGHMDNPSGVIDAPIGRDHRDPMRMAVVVDGKPARTHYVELATFTEPVDVAELECRLESGRTHQIRVHLAAVGHPVVGDVSYGGQRDTFAMPRPFLHAAQLGFDHPSTGEPLLFESPLPAELTSALARLR
jgi:23S rRNA pseudouridine1911/1915/1917 synthase